MFFPFVLHIFCYDIWFYLSHLLLHTRFLWRFYKEHYKTPMDIEWAKDGISGELFIVQARPETVQARKISTTLENFTLSKKSTILAQGLAIGSKIAVGQAQIINSAIVS